MNLKNLQDFAKELGEIQNDHYDNLLL